MKRNPTIAQISIMLIALGTIAVTAFVAWQRIANTRTTETAEGAGLSAAVKIGGPFTLTNHLGENVSDTAYRGRYLYIYFGYGYCPDVCPTELANMAATIDALGPQADKVQPLFITIDPERDTTVFLAEYVAQFHPQFIGLTGSLEEIASVAKSYRVFYRKAKDEDASEYLMDHSNFVYFMSDDGGFLTMFRGNTDPEAIAKTMMKYIEKG
jgi:cytochrome oxidase Cu insertion factor (SCO1/SenC/PrrC family)